jgi:AcrR family transcriptional regulator
VSIRDIRRNAAIDRMANHLLREGLPGASLRPLAIAAGTSDRMLLYYFANKDEILSATLEHVALRLAGLLDEIVPSTTRLSFGTLLSELWAATGSPTLQPFMRLWLDLAGSAARGLEPHRATSGHIADGFLAWIASRLDVPEADRAGSAAALLAVIEGLVVLDAVGRHDLAKVAAAALAKT